MAPISLTHRQIRVEGDGPGERLAGGCTGPGLRVGECRHHHGAATADGFEQCRAYGRCAAFDIAEARQRGVHDEVVVAQTELIKKLLQVITSHSEVVLNTAGATHQRSAAVRGPTTPVWRGRCARGKSCRPQDGSKWSDSST